MRACSAGNSSFHRGSSSIRASRTSPSVMPLSCLPARFPGGDDDLRRAKQAAQLVDDCRLDLGGRQAPDRASTPALLQDGLADIVAVELAALPGVGRRHGAACRAEDQPLEQRWRLRARAARLVLRGLSAMMLCTLSQSSCVMMAVCSPG